MKINNWLAGYQLTIRTPLYFLLNTYYFEKVTLFSVNS